MKLEVAIILLFEILNVIMKLLNIQNSFKMIVSMIESGLFFFLDGSPKLIAFFGKFSPHSLYYSEGGFKIRSLGPELSDLATWKSVTDRLFMA